MVVSVWVEDLQNMFCIRLYTPLRFYTKVSRTLSVNNLNTMCTNEAPHMLIHVYSCYCKIISLHNCKRKQNKNDVLSYYSQLCIKYCKHHCAFGTQTLQRNFALWILNIPFPYKYISTNSKVLSSFFSVKTFNINKLHVKNVCNCY